MNSYRITLIPGDGIGPEVTHATLKILSATPISFEWEPVIAGQEAIDKHGDPLPAPTLEAIQKNRVALKGPISTPIAKGFSSVNVLLRKRLNLYANLRPVKTFSGLKLAYPNIDAVIVRENTEDLYAGIEHEVVPGVVESIKVITEKASTRIAEFAFSYAKKHGRKKVTAIHKANIMKLSDGLFLKSCRGVSVRYPEIEYQELIVDNTCMQLVMRPGQFDVMVLENLYGDIVSDLCAGLVGGLGLVPGANLGDEAAIFEAVHGSAPDIAGKNIANPIAMTLSAVLMLKYLGETKVAHAIEKAIEQVLEAKEKLTPDLGGSATTDQLTNSIIEATKQFL